MLRAFISLAAITACSAPGGSAQPDAAANEPDAPVVMPDAPSSGVPLAGFGDLSGDCGVLGVADFTGAVPELFRDTLTFARRYNDPADRSLLTMGGERLASTANAGGSSGFSEIFAFEELDRCELATLLHTETEVTYDGTGKMTDMEVDLAGHKLGVSVTRAMTYPLGQTYSLSTATALMTKKLQDIQASTGHVSAQDKWDKQILAVLAYDDAAADTVAQAWAGLDAGIKADTIVIVTVTGGDDTFIYTNQ